MLNNASVLLPEFWRVGEGSNSWRIQYLAPAAAMVAALLAVVVFSMLVVALRNHNWRKAASRAVMTIALIISADAFRSLDAGWAFSAGLLFVLGVRIEIGFRGTARPRNRGVPRASSPSSSLLEDLPDSAERLDHGES